MSETENYKYSAFINYRHTTKERKCAEWLLNALETYRVPKGLQKVGFPARLGKVFRDIDELASVGSLNNQIETALRASRFLIVTCSPETPKSRWVSREIEIFKELGRGDKIFPLLVEGEPNESFPTVLTTRQLIGFDEAEANPPVKDFEPIGADMRAVEGKREKEIKRNELLRIVAGIIGCNFEGLKQREKQREKKRRKNRIIYAAIACLLLIAGSLYYWDYNRVKTYYYNSYVNVYGVPKGIGQVNLNEVKARYTAYALCYQRHKLMKMVKQTGAVNNIPIEEGYEVDPWLVGIVEWRYQYDAQNKLDMVSLYDEKGISKATHNYEFTPDGKSATIFFRKISDQGEWRSISIDTTSILPGLGSDVGKSNIDQHFVQFDDNGYDSKRLFRTSYLSPAKDQMGTSGRAYQYDAYGNRISIKFLDQEGQLLLLKNGLFEINIVSSKSGLISEVFFYNKARETNYVEGGFARIINKYDLGNIIEQAYFDIDGKPILHKNGYAKLTQKYDDRGNVIEQAFFGIDGNPILSKYGLAKFTQKYDDRGNIIEVAYSGIDDNPILSKYGLAKFTQKFDARRNLIEQAYFGIDGKPILNQYGFAKLTQKYDDRGNLIEEAYFGIDGKTILNKDGFAKFTKKYNDRGKVIEQVYFGIDGKPMLY